MDLKKLIQLGKKAKEIADELQAKSASGSAASPPAAPKRTPGTIEARDAVVLYWRDVGEYDTGWYCMQYDADGKVVMEEGRVGESGDMTQEAVDVAKQLFREHFGRDLVWEQPDPGVPRYVGRLG